ncbi:MAG: hypothetical protein JWO98_2566 [Frankiales bacterium]|nr:hypothetical protein [Frankiales bacterium]
MERYAAMCPVCKRVVVVATSGRFYPHVPTSGRHVRGECRCLGSGKTPDAANTMAAEQVKP